MVIEGRGEVTEDASHLTEDELDLLPPQNLQTSIGLLWRMEEMWGSECKRRC